MFELMMEILAYLGAAFLIGLILGYLIWGWGSRRRLAAARADAASAVRTSVDGDLPLKAQLEGCQKERKRLEQALDRANGRVSRVEAKLEEAQARANSLAATKVPAPDPAPVQTPPPWAQSAPTPPPEPATAPDADPDAEPLKLTGLLRNPPQSDQSDDAAAEPAEPRPEPSEPLIAPASLLTEAPAETDDLKLIKGVGPVMEGVLNEKGVYLFRQIANFSDQDIAWVNDAIDAFPGRIDRDDWVGQARALYREKYGRSHEDPE